MRASQLLPTAKNVGLSFAQVPKGGVTNSDHTLRVGIETRDVHQT